MALSNRRYFGLQEIIMKNQDPLRGAERRKAAEKAKAQALSSGTLMDEVRRSSSRADANVNVDIVKYVTQGCPNSRLARIMSQTGLSKRDVKRTAAKLRAKHDL